MGSLILNSRSEAAICAMQARGDEVSQEVVRYVLSFGLPAPDQERMLQLAERSESGELTEEEGLEFDSYLHVGNLLAVMQSRARVALGREARNKPGS
jgi:hypothetical protein